LIKYFKEILDFHKNQIKNLRRILSDPIELLEFWTELRTPIYNIKPIFVDRKLKRIVRRFSRDWLLRVNCYKIGRTANPETRKYQKIKGKKIDVWIILYVSDNFDYVSKIEASLIRHFYLDPKCANDSPNAGGNTAPSKENCVYLAVVID